MSRMITVAALTSAGLLVAHAGMAQSQAAAQTATKTATAVVEQNVDGNGDIKVHDSGTVSVKPTLDPVQVSVFGSFSTGSRFSTDGLSIYTVPDGKILVIDGVTIGSNMSAVDHLLDATFQLSFGGSFFSLYVQPVAEGVFTGTNAAVFRKTEKVTAYAAPGTQVIVSASRDGAALTSTSVQFGLAGHLIDAPQ